MALHLSKKAARSAGWRDFLLSHQSTDAPAARRAPRIKRHTAPLDAYAVLLEHGWRCVAFDPATHRRTLVGPAGQVVDVSARELVRMAEGKE